MCTEDTAYYSVCTTSKCCLKNYHYYRKRLSKLEDKLKKRNVLTLMQRNYTFSNVSEMLFEHIIRFNWRLEKKFFKDLRGPGGRDDKGNSAFPPAHCAEIGVVGSIPIHGQPAVPWVYLCDLSCAVKISCGYSVWCCNL